MSRPADWFSVRIAVHATVRFHWDTLLHPSTDAFCRLQAQGERWQARRWVWRTLKSWLLRRPLPKRNAGEFW